jgi:inorganic pyrophosphatase
MDKKRCRGRFLQHKLLGGYMTKSTVIVTSGRKYLDIDGYAGCIAYAALLNLLGIKAKAISTVKFNESIPNCIEELSIKLDEYVPNKDDDFIVIDVSNVDFFDTIVKEDRIIEVIDHHTGYEQYWKERLGDKARIEYIGSVCTIIYEMWKEHDLLSKMSKDIALVMIAGILDNTLNLKAKVTTNRDRVAYYDLLSIADTTVEWGQKYFKECQEVIESDLEKFILDDTKIEYTSRYLPKHFTQLLVLDANNIINNKYELVRDTLNRFGQDWVLNLICLNDGKSYLITESNDVKANLESLFDKKFEGNMLALDDIWLRKEIIKKGREKESNLL